MSVTRSRFRCPECLSDLWPCNCTFEDFQRLLEADAAAEAWARLPRKPEPVTEDTFAGDRPYHRVQAEERQFDA